VCWRAWPQHDQWRPRLTSLGSQVLDGTGPVCKDQQAQGRPKHLHLLRDVIRGTHRAAKGMGHAEGAGYTHDTDDFGDQVKGYRRYARLLDLSRYQSTGLLADGSDRDQ